MNSIKINLSFGVMLLGIFALSFALHADANAVPENPYCKGADVVPKLKPLCLKMVGGAKTWEQAATYCINRILRKANRSLKPLMATIEAKLSPKLSPKQRADILDICRNSHADALQDLQESQRLITNPPFSSLESKLTSTFTSLVDCREAIVEENDQPDIVEVTQFTNRMERLLDVALVVAEQDPRNLDYKARMAKGEFKDSKGDESLIGPITDNFFGAHP